MKKRLKDAIIGTVLFAFIGFIVTFILNGEPLWNNVIGMAIGGFILWYFILPKMNSKKQTE